MTTLIWAALGGVAMLARFVDPNAGAALAQLGISLLALSFGLSVFWRHGGRQITAAGLYSLASAVFVGLAGIYWWSELGNEVNVGLYLATVFCFYSNLAMHRLFWQRITMPQQPPVVDLAAARWGIAAGAAVSTVSLSLYLGGLVVGATLLSEIVFGGMALLIVSLVVHPGRIGVVRTAAVAAVIGLYATTVFNGYGRLLLVALSLAAAVPLCLRMPGRSVKVLIVAAIWPTLAVLIYAREQFGIATYGTALDGSGSVTLPLSDFGRLIELYQHGLLDLGYGSTLLVSAVFIVPRAIWPTKPLGFGAELTRILQPEFAGTDFSLAAHLGGEWLYDFGYLGIPAMVLVMGWAVGRLDRFTAHRMGAALTDRRAVLLLAVVVIMLAAVPDLEWVGTFTYWTRTASRLVVPAFFLLLMAGPPAVGEPEEIRPARPPARAATGSAARR